MARIVRFHQTGGPDVLKLEQVDVPAPRPGPGEVLVRVRAPSLNSRNLMMIKGGLAPMTNVRGVESRDGGQPGPSGHR